MGSKIMFSGIVLILAAPLLSFIPAVATVGMVLAIIGVVLYDLDK